MGFSRASILAPTASAVVAALVLVTGPIVAKAIPDAGHVADEAARAMLARGENPYPVRLRRPQTTPLSALARVGERVFHDATLSGSGKVACATCHDPRHAYGPPGADPAVLAGLDGRQQGVRAVPSLMYLDRQPAFGIGAESGDGDEDNTPTLAQAIAAASTVTLATKTAGGTAAAANPVPQGGLFWDGRADTLQSQTMGPLLSPFEMAGGSVETVAAKLRHAPYANQLARLFGPGVLAQPRLLVDEAMSAVARYEVESPKFHPYSSKFDAWLEGRARFTPAEMRGYRLFNDPEKANCAGCHLDQPGRDGAPPLFTDHEFEALSPPRNPALRVNADPTYHDLGLCGPYRADLKDQPALCGLFLTPTLRNVATRKVFFHNGVFHTLRQVLDFYDFRDVAPEKVYPRGPDGRVAKDDDIPAIYRADIDVTDPPFDRHPGQPPAMTDQEEEDIIAFLGTLTDGYRPPLRR